MPRILIVEDDETLAGLMASVLSDAGHEPEIVQDPEAARGPAGAYDLVVSDYMAPAYAPGQPWPFLERLRALSRQGKVLGCTGHHDALADEPAALGVSAVTSKPFDVDQLIRVVEDLIAEGQATLAARDHAA